MAVAAKKVSTGSNQNMMGAMAYFLWWVTGIVLLLVEKDNKFVRFHAAQSTVVFGIITVLLMIPILNILLGIILAPAGFILWLILMWKAYQGETFKLPLIGEWAVKLETKIK